MILGLQFYDALRFNDILRTISSSSESDQWKDDFQAMVDDQFQESPTIKIITHNNSYPLKARVVNIFSSESPNRNMEDYQKIIFSNRDYKVNVGDTFKFDDLNWLTIDVSINLVSKSCVVAKCNNILNIYVDDTLHEVPCIVDPSDHRMALGENRNFTELSDNIIVRVPNNNITYGIDINDIYKIGKWSYKITNLGDITEPGLIILKMQFSSEQQQAPHGKTNPDYIF